MEAVFLNILNMSLTATYVIVAIFLVRLLMRRAPKKYSYWLWAVAAFRLVCPVSFSAIFSLLQPLGVPVEDHTVTYIKRNIAYRAQPSVNVGIPAVSEVVTSSLPAATPQNSVNPMQLWLFAGMVIWCMGMAALLLYGLFSTLRLRRRMQTATRWKDHIYQSEQVCSPFILGVIRPKIYMPYGLEEQTRTYVLTHEAYHLRQRDHWVKLFAWLILMLHWFNPLVWAAFYAMGRDMEMRCDEKVLEQEGSCGTDYSMTLLSFAANRRLPSPSPLAFGESAVKSRIRNALRWKKSGSWLQVAAVIVCVSLSVACAANPTGESTITLPPQTPEETVQPEQSKIEAEQPEEPVVEQQTPTETSQVQLPEALTTPEAVIHQAILEYNGAFEQEVGRYGMESHVELTHLVGCGTAQDEPAGFDIYYLMVLYQELAVENGQLVDYGSSHSPVAITVETGQDGTMSVSEYWVPRDGSYWLEDVREKFPEFVWEQVDTQMWIEVQKQNIYTQAVQQGLVDAESAIKALLEVYITMPEGEAVLQERELRYYANETLRYLAGEFFRGGQTGERAERMLWLLCNLLAEEAPPFDYGKPQAVFDEWVVNAMWNLDSNGREFMEQNYPKTMIVLGERP